MWAELPKIMVMSVTLLMTGTVEPSDNSIKKRYMTMSWMGYRRTILQNRFNCF